MFGVSCDGLLVASGAQKFASIILYLEITTNQGGIEEAACVAILQHLDGGDQLLSVDETNFQDLLEGRSILYVHAVLAICI